MNAPVAAKRNTFFRPHVSAKNPHKCDENTIPKYEIPVSTPCSRIVSSRSHFAYGKIQLTFVFSTDDPSNESAMHMVRTIWHFPISKMKCREQNLICDIFQLTKRFILIFHVEIDLLASSTASSNVYVYFGLSPFFVISIDFSLAIFYASSSLAIYSQTD